MRTKKLEYLFGEDKTIPQSFCFGKREGEGVSKNVIHASYLAISSTGAGPR